MGDARSIAKLYGSAATGSEIGLSPTILDALKLPAISPTKGLRDKVLQVDMKYSLGFSKPVRQSYLGPRTMHLEHPEQAARSDLLIQTSGLDSRMYRTGWVTT